MHKYKQQNLQKIDLGIGKKHSIYIVPPWKAWFSLITFHLMPRFVGMH